MNGFTEQELEIQFRIKDRKGRVDTPVFSAPVTPAENMRRTVFEKNPASMLHNVLAIFRDVRPPNGWDAF